jgi:hypothetical protein
MLASDEGSGKSERTNSHRIQLSASNRLFSRKLSDEQQVTEEPLLSDVLEASQEQPGGQLDIFEQSMCQIIVKKVASSEARTSVR